MIVQAVLITVGVILVVESLMFLVFSSKAREVLMNMSKDKNLYGRVLFWELLIGMLLILGSVLSRNFGFA